jgi:hypothetical protein
MTDNKATEIVKTAQELIDWLLEKLSEYESWNVIKYSGTSTSNLFRHLPELQLPAAVVMYKGSSFSDETPRRSSSFSVVVAVEDVGDLNTAAEEVQPLVEKTIELVDHELYDDVLFRTASDGAIDLDTNIAAYEISFTADNY